MGMRVGTIDLGLDVNSSSFNKQLNGIARSAEKSTTKAFSGLGGKIGAAIGFAAVAAFTKSCLDLGSNLQEVQNVVNVTFGAMSNDIDTFAKGALKQFGLSETSAKKYASTVGAMSKSFGFTTQAAADMGKQITGRTADIASFWNLSNEESFTKMKSIFTGETESLKEIGVVMTQNALDQFALQKGYGKTTKSMTEQEKVALRLAFVMDKTSLAAGDFERTSGGWANQTRMLTEQFNALKATLGQAFINLLTPVVRVLNEIISRLQVAAAYFKAFTEAAFGKQESGGGQVVKDINAMTEGATGAGEAVEGIGDSAKEAGKKAKGALAGFDEINSLSFGDDKGSSSGMDTGMTTVPEIDLGIDKSMDSMTNFGNKVKEVFGEIKKEAIRLADIFKGGFFKGLGDNADFSGIKADIECIKKSLLEIFTNPELKTSAKRFTDSFFSTLGVVTGSIASMGVTVAELFIGGFSKYLEQNTGYLTSSLIKIFDIGTSINEKVGQIFIGLADIFSVFGSDSGKQIVANILDCIMTASIELIILGQKIGLDFLTGIADGIEVNMDATKVAIGNSLKILEVLSGTVKKLIEDSFASLQSSYDEYIGPSIKKFIGGFTSMQTTILDFYNTYLAPTLKNMADKFDKLYDDAIKPFVNEFIKLFGQLTETLTVFWEKRIVEPFNWIVKTFGPGLTTVFEGIGDTVDTVIRVICGVLSGLMESLRGILMFLSGTFEGDWEKAWNGVKTVFSGVWNSLVSIAKAPLNLIIDMVNSVIRSINKISFKVPESVSSMPGMGWSAGIGWNGPNIGEIQKLAKGGIVDQPTLAMVGEAGKEAVVPLQNNTEWTGQVADLLLNALLPILNGSGIRDNNESNRDIVLELNGIELVRAFLPDLLREFSRKGIVIE